MAAPSTHSFPITQRPATAPAPCHSTQSYNNNAWSQCGYNLPQSQEFFSLCPSTIRCPIKITSLFPNLYRKLDFPRHMNTSLCLQFYILHHKNSPFLSLPDDPVTTHSPCLSCQPFSHCRKKTPASLPQTEPPCFCGNQTPPPEYP